MVCYDFIKTFEQFILESKGISDAVYDFNDKIWKDIKPLIINKMSTDIGSKFAFIKIYNNLDNDFKFVYLRIFVNIHIILNTSYSCVGEANFNNSEMLDGMLNNPDIKIDIYNNSKELSESNFDDIKSTILHELVHVFQRFKQGLKKIDSNWQLGSLLPKITNNLKTKLGQLVVNCLYNSLKHEVAANLHQYYMYKKDNKHYSSIFYIKKNLETFGGIITKIDTYTPDMMADIEQIRHHYIRSIEHHKPNDKYFNHVELEWKTPLTIDNIHDFLTFLDINIFKPTLKKIEKKIVMIDKKISDIDYDYHIPESFKFANIMNIN